MPALIRVLILLLPMLLRPEKLWPLLDLITLCKIKWLCNKHQEILDRTA